MQPQSPPARATERTAGDLYAMILFSRTRVPREVAELFRTLSLNVKVALLPFVDRKVFA